MYEMRNYFYKCSELKYISNYTPTKEFIFTNVPIKNENRIFFHDRWKKNVLNIKLTYYTIKT